jgi:hypothetical protein
VVSSNTGKGYVFKVACDDPTMLICLKNTVFEICNESEIEVENNKGWFEE